MEKKKGLLFLIVVLLGALVFVSVPASASEDLGHSKPLAGARKGLEQELLPLAGAGFVGIAHSEEEGEIVVFVENEQVRRKVPRFFKGYTVRTIVTGKVQSLSTLVVEPLANVSEQRKQEVRPLVGGISVSAYVTRGQSLYLYAGTLGMVTYNNKILSNAHVIAMHPETASFLPIGTPIVQPGTLDGGRWDDRVGSLEAYIPINFSSGATNYADAAIGSINAGINASPGEQFCEAGDYWIAGWTEVSTGDVVRKSGRTTGVTTGEVIYTNAAVTVQYGSKLAYFMDQIVVSQENWSFATRGDSGSAVDKDGQFVGLLFAGSANYAIVCKAKYIIQGLNITLEPSETRYRLTISSTQGGRVITPGEGTFLYNSDEVVDIVAMADEHYHFVEWTGDVATIADVYSSSTNITMNGDYSIAAKFELDEGWYSLAVSSTQGGNVTEPGEGVFVYGNYTVVNLRAEHDQHYHFVEWTGDVETIADVYNATTTISMNASYSITANFELDEGWYSLTVSSTEGGSVTQPGEGIFVYENNTVVDLSAMPDEGYEFVSWTGDVSTIADVNSASTNITMLSSYSITAIFEPGHPEPVAQLIISSTRGGSVTQPGEGTFWYPLGAKVSLVAEPDESCLFVRWLGDVGTIADIYSASTTITMDRSYSIAAEFRVPVMLPCFIATAAYGTPLAEEVQILREFREGHLLTNPIGQAFVKFYYIVSPPIAEFITEHPSLKPVVRAGLSPVITVAALLVRTSGTEMVAIVGLLVLASIGFGIWATRRMDKVLEYRRR